MLKCIDRDSRKLFLTMLNQGQSKKNVLFFASNIYQHYPVEFYKVCKYIDNLYDRGNK